MEQLDLGALMSARDNFELTMKRVERIVRFHEEIANTRGRPPRHLSDMLRGALVLAVAGLDAAVLDGIAEAVPAVAESGELGEAAANWAKKEPEKVILMLGENDPTQAFAKFAQDHLSSMTFQKSAAIQGVLWDVLRCPPPWERAAAGLEDVSTEEIRDDLDTYVLRRHRIAHDGDVRPDGNLRSIRRQQVRRAVRIIRAVGLAIQDEIDDLVSDLEN